MGLMLAGDTFGLYVGPQPELEGRCSPVHDFTIFALDTELPYIRAAWTLLARTKVPQVEKPNVAASETRHLWAYRGMFGSLSRLAETYAQNYRGPFCIGVMRADPVPPMGSSPSAM